MEAREERGTRGTGATSARRDRVSTARGGRASDGTRGNEGEKERRCARKERRNEISRESEREDVRVKAGGRERKRASACPAEGARRPHMCSETNVRSECRLLPIIRCRGVPLCARGWSADSVPRFYAARQPGLVRARGYPRKPRAKCIAIRVVDDRAARLELSPRAPRVGLSRVGVVRSW